MLQQVSRADTWAAGMLLALARLSSFMHIVRASCATGSRLSALALVHWLLAIITCQTRWLQSWQHQQRIRSGSLCLTIMGGMVIIIDPNRIKRMHVGLQEFSTAAGAAEPLQQVLGGGEGQFFPDSSSLSASGLIEGVLLPQDTESVSLHGVALADGQQAVLLLASGLPRAFSQRDRGWASAMARKLSNLHLKV